MNLVPGTYKTIAHSIHIKDGMPYHHPLSITSAHREVILNTHTRRGLGKYSDVVEILKLVTHNYFNREGHLPSLPSHLPSVPN